MQNGRVFNTNDESFFFSLSFESRDKWYNRIAIATTAFVLRVFYVLSTIKLNINPNTVNINNDDINCKQNIHRVFEFNMDLFSKCTTRANKRNLTVSETKNLTYTQYTTAI